ncbi:hypothetical protein AOLI_G00186310 [Acnodon oligacanthus]
MKKTRSTTLRRAWPSSDFSDRVSERTRSRSEKDYRLHKHYAKPFISHSVSHSPRIYMAAALACCRSSKLADCDFCSAPCWGVPGFDSIKQRQHNQQHCLEIHSAGSGAVLEQQLG